MARLSVSSWIGNAAAVLCGGFGAVTQRAREAGCSRQTVYKHAVRVEHAVKESANGQPTYQELWAENQGLARENEELWQAFSESVFFPKSKQQQFATTAIAMGLSLSQALLLLAIVLPASTCPSRATLGRWLAHWAARAGELLRVLDRHCQKWVVCLCIDEIFLGRKPVLVGVEPHSMAWVIGQKAEHRDGLTWREALQPWGRLEYAVADAGTGLRKGLALVREARQDVVDAPAMEVGLDVFHIKKEALPVITRMWRKVESVWEKAEAADREVARCRRQGEDARKAAATAHHAWAAAERAFREAEAIEAAWRRAAAALELFRPDGSLNERAWAEAEIAAALTGLDATEWSKVRRMLSDPCALTFLDRMHRQLREAEPNESLRAELVRLWWLRRRRAAESRGTQAGRAHAAHLVQTVVCEKLALSWRESYVRVSQVLQHTVRASSVVECMNSVIRMHQARHRSLTQPLLDLKRLWWNTRPFREGRRRERSPYQHLGVRLPVEGFWSLLQLAPEDLSQHLSTLPVAL
jgi:hypothetical protein